MINFQIERWYGAFITWMRRNRADEALQVMSDCSNEQYLNALTSLHLRQHGRELGLPLFWARMEWAKTDICYGNAARKFANWNAAWENETCGNLGQIEAKVLYWHYANSKHLDYLQTLGDQLRKRRNDNITYKRNDEAYHGLIWLVCFSSPEQSSTLDEQIRDWSSTVQWVDSFTQCGLKSTLPMHDRPEGVIFDHLGDLPLAEIWPVENCGTASLFTSLCTIL